MPSRGRASHFQETRLRGNGSRDNIAAAVKVWTFVGKSFSTRCSVIVRSRCRSLHASSISWFTCTNVPHTSVFILYSIPSPKSLTQVEPSSLFWLFALARRLESRADVDREAASSETIHFHIRTDGLIQSLFLGLRWV